MVRAGSDIWRSPSPTLLVTQIHFNQVARECIQTSLGSLQRRRFHSLSEQPVLVLYHSQSKEVFFPWVQMKRTHLYGESRHKAWIHRQGTTGSLTWPTTVLRTWAQLKTDNQLPCHLQQSKAKRFWRLWCVLWFLFIRTQRLWYVTCKYCWLRADSKFINAVRWPLEDNLHNYCV